jgi:hypothetical protein
MQYDAAISPGAQSAGREKTRSDWMKMSGKQITSNSSNITGTRAMAENIDDISINYEEEGVLIVKELDKVVLSRGAWTTIIFRYQQWDGKTNDYGPDRYTIRRYRKLRGTYQAQGKFNISSREQAQKIVEALQAWLV